MFSTDGATSEVRLGPVLCPICENAFPIYNVFATGWSDVKDGATALFVATSEDCHFIVVKILVDVSFEFTHWECLVNRMCVVNLCHKFPSFISCSAISIQKTPAPRASFMFLSVPQQIGTLHDCFFCGSFIDGVPFERFSSVTIEVLINCVALQTCDLTLGDVTVYREQVFTFECLRVATFTERHWKLVVADEAAASIVDDTVVDKDDALHSRKCIAYNIEFKNFCRKLPRDLGDSDDHRLSAAMVVVGAWAIVFSIRILLWLFASVTGVFVLIEDFIFDSSNDGLGP